MTMANVAERHETFAAAFAAFQREAGGADDARRTERLSAFERFCGRGLPTTRDEEWRFTNVAPIGAANFTAAAAANPAPASIETFLLNHAAGIEIVVANGRLSRTLSSLDGLPAGVHVSANARPADHATTGTAFVDLNTAFFPETVTIDVAPGVVVETPIHVLFVNVAGSTPVMVTPRLRVTAGEQSSVTLIESHGDVGAGTVFTNIVTEVRVAAAALVDHVKLQRQGATSFHLAHVSADVARTGTFTSHAITLGGAISRNDIVSVLAGEGAECTLNGLYVANGDSVVDTHTTIDHAQPHCPSHEVYKGILAGRARAVFNGKIIVRPDAQKTNAKQTNKALLLTDDAQVNSKPQLEIFADDVKCTHGAAIGQLDEDALFYLRARGIGALQARNMLIHAFAGEVLDGIRVEAVRDTAMNLVEQKLNLMAS